MLSESLGPPVHTHPLPEEKTLQSEIEKTRVQRNIFAVVGLIFVASGLIVTGALGHKLGGVNALWNRYDSVIILPASLAAFCFVGVISNAMIISDLKKQQAQEEKVRVVKEEEPKPLADDPLADIVPELRTAATPKASAVNNNIVAPVDLVKDENALKAKGDEIIAQIEAVGRLSLLKKTFQSVQEGTRTLAQFKTVLNAGYSRLTDEEKVAADKIVKDVEEYMAIIEALKATNSNK